MASSQESKDSGDTSCLGSSSQAKTPQALLSSDTLQDPFFDDLAEAFSKIPYGHTLSSDASQNTVQESELIHHYSQEDPSHSPSEDHPGKDSPTESRDADSSEPIPFGTGELSLDFHFPATETTLPAADTPSTEKESLAPADVENQKVMDSKAIEPLDSSGNTVEKIYKQYATAGQDEDPSNMDSTVSPTVSPAPLSHDEATTQYNFRGEDTYRHRKNRHFTAGSNPPQGPPPALPQSHRRSRSFLGLVGNSSLNAESTVSDSQHLLDAEAQASELQKARKPFFPSPLRLPKKRNPKGLDSYKHDEFSNDIGSFDVTNGSNDDPFKYDDGQYKTVLKPTNERDVSQALRRASKVGGSEATIVTPEGSPRQKAVTGATTLGGNHPAGRLLTDSQFQSSDPANKGVREVKVIIRSQKRSAKNGDNNGNREERISKQTLKTLPRGSTGDWVTDATSDVDLGSNHLLDNSRIVKTTGSSVADCSDDEEQEQGMWSSVFSSRRRVLQHPTAKAQPESYELRKLAGTKQPVYLPKSGINRPGGNPGNSTRFFSDNPIISQGRPALTTKFSNPFGRNDSYSRADLDGNFSFKAGRNGPSRYDFRDSVSTAPRDHDVSGIAQSGTLGSMAEAGPTNGDLANLTSGTQPDTPEFASTSSNQREFSSSQPEIRHVDESYPVRNGYRWRAEQEQKRQRAEALPAMFNGEPLSAKSKFEFELLPLDEAQRKNKQQRDSGEKDETESAQVRFHRAMSASSSRQFPSLSTLETPKPVHPRPRRHEVAPHLSLNFTPTKWHSYGDAFNETPSPFSATDTQDMSPTSCGPNRSLLYHGSPPPTPTTRTGTSASTKRKWFGRYKPLTFSSNKRGRRDFSDQTVIHHPLAETESGLSVAALEALMEETISMRGRNQRKIFFYIMATLSIIVPLFAILVLIGALNGCLSWWTRGEVQRLTIQQRNFIRNTFLTECCIYFLLIASVLAVFTKKH
ncbi:hypothetical protein F4677DRAFT_460812 [Hypoxylon crocopeplum]|nr:hypothetical protein F4677DRAFT_460812 [Hypoxylon crocopeplum]